MNEALPTMLLVFLLGWMAFFIQGDKDYFARSQAVSNITYRYTQAAGKMGEMNDAIYEEMMEKLKLYGDFEIHMVAENFTAEGTVESRTGEELLNFDLRGNGYDILNVSVQSNKNHWIGKVLELSPFGSKMRSNYRLFGKSSVYIQ